MNSPLVSICCLTFNHEKYIEKTIKGFLMQEVDFQYEIIIHDDASTDQTADIIRRYAEKNPTIIKPILQKENQYSKGNSIIADIIFPMAKGKYIAICEGDDYWTHKLKLKSQVDYMEKNNECTLCFHAADISYMDKKIIGKISPYSKSCVSKPEDIIRGGGAFCATSSLLFQSRLVKKMPQFFFSSPCGDYPLQIYLASLGYGYYINKSMSVYQVGHIGSWTYRINNDADSIRRKIDHYNKMIILLEDFNAFSDYRYAESVEDMITKQRMKLHLLKRDYSKLFSLKNLKCILLYNWIKRITYLTRLCYVKHMVKQ